MTKLKFNSQQIKELKKGFQRGLDNPVLVTTAMINKVSLIALGSLGGGIILGVVLVKIFKNDSEYHQLKQKKERLLKNYKTLEQRIYDIDQKLNSFSDDDKL